MTTSISSCGTRARSTPAHRPRQTTPSGSRTRSEDACPGESRCGPPQRSGLAAAVASQATNAQAAAATGIALPLKLAAGVTAVVALSLVAFFGLTRTPSAPPAPPRVEAAITAPPPSSRLPEVALPTLPGPGALPDAKPEEAEGAPATPPGRSETSTLDAEGRAPREDERGAADESACRCARARR